MSNSRVNWYEQDVLAVVDGATQEGLLAIAFQIEAIAKTKAAVDTGFMRNSSYVTGGDTNTFQASSQEINGRQYETVSSPEPAPPGGATVGFGADYTIYEESRQPFVYPAAVQAMQDAGGILETVGRQHFGD